MLNGYNYLNLTKIDILTGISKLKVAVSYSFEGKKLPSMPGSLDVLSKVEIEYLDFDGWSEDISKVTRFEDLPENCIRYIKFIENYIEVPIKWIGVGSGRLDMIVRDV